MTMTTLMTPSVTQSKLVPFLQEKLFTGEEALDLGLDQPFDLVSGRIVFIDHTGDEHGFLESEISRYLGNFNVTRKLGWVLTGEVGVYTQQQPDTVRGVDVARLPNLHNLHNKKLCAEKAF